MDGNGDRVGRGSLGRCGGGAAGCGPIVSHGLVCWLERRRGHTFTVHPEDAWSKGQRSQDRRCHRQLRAAIGSYVRSSRGRCRGTTGGRFRSADFGARCALARLTQSTTAASPPAIGCQPQHRSACGATGISRAALPSRIPPRRERATAPVAHRPGRIRRQGIDRAHRHAVRAVVADQRVHDEDDRELLGLTDCTSAAGEFARAAADAVVCDRVGHCNYLYIPASSTCPLASNRV